VVSALDRPVDEIEYEPVVDAERGVVSAVRVRTPGVRTLWPAKWPIEALLLDMLASSSRSVWVREKLNDLRAMAGKVFRRSWFRYVSRDETPTSFERVIQVWDTAFDEDAAADWSVCGTLGLVGGRVYVLDVFREKLEFPRLIPAMVSLWQRWRPERVLVEEKASGKSAIQVVRSETTVPIVGVSPGGKDKLSRARAVTVYLETGRVLFAAGASWLEVFENELVLFPDGANDDQVDMLVYGLLELMVGDGSAPVAVSSQVVARLEGF